MEAHKLWHIGDLKQFIANCDHSLQHLSSTVDSLARAAVISDFHVRECHDQLAKFEGDAQDISSLKWVLSNGQDRFTAEQNILAAEAHLVAAINVTRSMFDIFSQLMNGLLLNSKLSDRSCSVEGVAKALHAGTLKDQLNSLISSGEFKYMVAFINTIKHRTLISHQYHINIEKNRAGIIVLAFTFKGDQYAEQWAYEVLAATHEVRNALPDLGIALNSELGVRATYEDTLPSPRVIFELGS